jgi:hypothetical protein
MVSPPIRWVPGALSLRVTRPGREAKHPPPSCVEVKHSPNTPSWCGAQLKHRDNFTFTFTFECVCSPYNFLNNRHCILSHSLSDL